MLSDTETEILKNGLKHCIFKRSSQIEMIVIAEKIWDQIEQNWLCNGKQLNLHWEPLLTLI